MSSPSGPTASTRVRLLEGALDCLRRDGTRFSFADVARSSGVARQTIYAHFPHREDLLNAAIEHAALTLTEQIAAETKDVTSTPEALVEIVVAFHQAAQRDTAIAQVIAMTLHPRTADRGTISAGAMRMTRSFIRPRIADDVPPEAVDEIAEVFLRFLLSVLSYSSANTETPAALRNFLQRRMVPALGLG